MKSILYFLQYLFISSFFTIMKLLPISFSKTLFSYLFKFIGNISKVNKTALQNCKIVFPNLKNKEVEEIISQSWINLGKTICELLYLKKIVNDEKFIKIKGLDNIEPILRYKRQAIYISIHQSNWEVIVPRLDKLGIKIGAIYRHINNKFLDTMLLNLRNNSLTSTESFYTPKGKRSAKEILYGIQNSLSMFILIDQKDTAGENIILFNKQVKTQIGFLKIARKFNLPIIPIQNTRLENDQIELNFLEPIFHDDDKINDTIMMQNIHKIVENWITLNPNQWFWQHKRFN